MPWTGRTALVCRSFAGPGSGPVPNRAATQNIHLETDRLVLRSWELADLEPFADMNADPAVMEFYPSTLDREESYAPAQWIQQSLDDQGFGFYAVEAKDGGGFIGYVGLSSVQFDAAFTPAIEIAWRLAKPAWGKGYASEAAKACLDHGFNVQGFTEIVSFTTPANQRSIAVMERIGMSRDAGGDFEHPNLPAGHELAPHALYRKIRPSSS